MARRNRNIAKNAIYDVFRRFVSNGQTKITVSAIIEAAGMTRKTFYNHFANQDELVAWGFRKDLLDSLLRHWDISDLVESASDIYNFEGLPCYGRISVHALSLDQSQYFRDFYDTFLKYENYYRAILRSEFSVAFCRYLEELFQGLFYEDMDYFLNGRKMPEEAKRYTAAFYATGVVRGMINAFMGFVENSNVRHIHPVNNLAHEGMRHIVETYQMEKSIRHFGDRIPPTSRETGRSLL